MLFEEDDYEEDDGVDPTQWDAKTVLYLLLMILFALIVPLHC